MMNSDVINAAAVDVERLTEQVFRHRRTLDVPARETAAPRGIPFHLADGIGRRKFPECKIRWVFFLAIELDAYAGLFIADSLAGKLAVAVEFGGIKINTVANAIGVAFVFQFFYERDLFLNVIRCMRAIFACRSHDIQAGQVFVEKLLVLLGDFPCVSPLLGCFFLDFIVSGVTIANQMADIGDVHDMMNFVAEQNQGALQDVLKYIGTEVADGRWIVDGRATSIEADVLALDRFELFQSPMQRIPEREHAQKSSGNRLFCHERTISSPT
jgi:hypothetical protein